MIKFALFFVLISLGIIVFAAPMTVQNVTWTSPRYVTVIGNSLNRSNPEVAGWVAGAFSVQKIDAGLDGYFEMTAQETNAHRFGGLSSVDIDFSYTSVEFAIFLTKLARVYIGENGAHWEVSTYQTGDIFRVSREGTNIKYYQNGILLYTSAYLSSTDLYADTSLHSYSGSSPIATIYNAKIASNASTVPEPSTLGLILVSFLLLFNRSLRIPNSVLNACWTWTRLP